MLYVNVKWKVTLTMKNLYFFVILYLFACCWYQQPASCHEGHKDMVAYFDDDYIKGSIRIRMHITNGDYKFSLNFSNEIGDSLGKLKAQNFTLNIHTFPVNPIIRNRCADIGGVHLKLGTLDSSVALNNLPWQKPEELTSKSSPLRLSIASKLYFKSIKLHVPSSSFGERKACTTLFTVGTVFMAAKFRVGVAGTLYIVRDSHKFNANSAVFGNIRYTERNVSTNAKQSFEVGITKTSEKRGNLYMSTCKNIGDRVNVNFYDLHIGSPYFRSDYEHGAEFPTGDDINLNVGIYLAKNQPPLYCTKVTNVLPVKLMANFGKDFEVSFTSIYPGLPTTTNITVKSFQVINIEDHVFNIHENIMANSEFCKKENFGKVVKTFEFKQMEYNSNIMIIRPYDRVQVYGPDSVAYRTLVIYNLTTTRSRETARVWKCAPIIMEGAYHAYTAEFSGYLVQGTVRFWHNPGFLSQTSIEVNVQVPAQVCGDKERCTVSNVSWSIYSSKYLGSSNACADIVRYGNILNPFNVEANDVRCNKYDMALCRQGDLTAKHGTLDISNGYNNVHHDDNLDVHHLKGNVIVIIAGGETLLCAFILPVQFANTEDNAKSRGMFMLEEIQQAKILSKYYQILSNDSGSNHITHIYLLSFFGCLHGYLLLKPII